MDFQDRTLQCQDCGQDFVFEAREQQFYADKGFGDPKRCRTCRDKKKQDKRANRQVTEVTCAKCSAQTTVPFTPRPGGPPVLCNACFQEQGGKRGKMRMAA